MCKAQSTCGLGLACGGIAWRSALARLLLFRLMHRETIVTQQLTRPALPGAYTRQRYAALGTIASAAPRAALLAALRELRPELQVRLLPLQQAAQETCYRVELRLDPGRPPAAARDVVDPWLRIKSALVAAFPQDKPGAVRACDPHSASVPRP